MRTFVGVSKTCSARRASFWILAVVIAGRMAAQSYTIIELPPVAGAAGSGGYAINAQGQVAGESDSRATVWTKGVPRDIQTMDTPYSVAYAINDSGNAVGDTQSAQKNRETADVLKQHQQQYETAIVLYGIVLEDAGHPVPQARVEYKNADPTGNWTWKELRSGADGAFVISGVRGRYLDVQVSHPDYYETPESKHSFTYAGNDRGPDFRSNPARPEVFRLRKRGQAAELVHRSDQVLFNANEPERSFSLFDHTRRRDRPEYVVIRPVDRGRKNARGQRVLDLELSAPTGGLQPRTDASLFVAPVDGYQSTVIAPASASVNPVDYFVRFDSGNYGRFTIAGNRGQFDVDSYFNPDRSPNLEFDPAKEITVIRNGQMGVDLSYPPKDDGRKP